MKTNKIPITGLENGNCCPKCGSPVQEGMRYCPGCGERHSRSIKRKLFLFCYMLIIHPYD